MITEIQFIDPDRLGKKDHFGGGGMNELPRKREIE